MGYQDENSTSETRCCTRCGTEKPIEDFAWRCRNNGLRQSWCRNCHSKRAADRYAALSPSARSARRRAARARIAELRARLWEYLRTRRCVDCGAADPFVFELDHRGDKIGNVADLISGGFSWNAIEIELSKCDVRCANCHRRRTAERRGDGQPTMLPPVRASRGICPVPVEAPAARVCQRCGQLLPASDFAWRSREQATLQQWCKRCHNEYKRSVYVAEKSRHVALVVRHAKSRASRNRTSLARYLAKRGCVDCGVQDQPVLEFDHRHDKRANISTLIAAGRAWTTIVEELAKCEVRCANCHRRRTAIEQGYAGRKRGT